MNLKLYLAQSPALWNADAMSAPALQQLLAASRRRMVDLPLPAVLCNEFGMKAQGDRPLAALSWLGEGNDPGGDYWLHADPVHLALQRDYFTLSHPAPLALGRPHAETLTTELNRHFAEDGLQFHLGTERADGTRWYLRLPAAPRLHTSLPQQAAGHDIRPFLPQGEDAPAWQRLANEVQMLLHDHPINALREAAGLLPVNSLWFSGGGVLPRTWPRSTMSVLSDMPLATGLALASGRPCETLPQEATILLNAPCDTALLALGDMERAERAWFAPLLRALRGRKLGRLELYLDLGDRTLTAQVRWFDLWKPWHRPQPLDTYFSA